MAAAWLQCANELRPVACIADATGTGSPAPRRTSAATVVPPAGPFDGLPVQSLFPSPCLPGAQYLVEPRRRPPIASDNCVLGSHRFRKCVFAEIRRRRCSFAATSCSHASVISPPTPNLGILQIRDDAVRLPPRRGRPRPGSPRASSPQFAAPIGRASGPPPEMYQPRQVRSPQ
jgi:hypothetical protein